MSTLTTFFFFFFQSIVYNNVVVTKQIYFSTTFLKSWVRISDNVAGAVGGPQYWLFSLTLFKIGLFGAAQPPLSKICHASYNDETSLSYTFPKEYPKSI